MGVHGLWPVLEPTGRTVNVNSLRGKVLAVDVSIWLHQLVKGFRDKDGNPLPNAHLLGVFHRVCKLLHYGIKPVFVFDGGVPVLKRQTMLIRRKKKLEALDKSEVSRQKMLSNYLRQQLQRQTREALPPSMRMEAQIKAMSSPKKSVNSNSSSPVKTLENGKSASKGNPNQFDVFEVELQKFREKFDSQSKEEEEERKNSSEEEDEYRRYGMDYSENFSEIVSPDFDVLPLETQHEILFEMQESRKMNSWGKIDEMPQNLQDFSSFQMDRLVKRRFLQKKIQTVQQEMGQRHIHVQNLDELLKMDYNFDETSKVLGSKEKGFVLVQKSPQKSHEPGDVPGLTKVKAPSPTASQSRIPAIEDECIELKDNWSSSSEGEDIQDIVAEDVKPRISAGTSNTHDSNRDNNKDSKLEEEDRQLALAIQMSLEESKEVPVEKEVQDKKFDMEQLKSTDLENGTQASSSKADNFNQSRPRVTTGLSLKSLRSQKLPSSCSKFLDIIGYSERVSSVAVHEATCSGSQNESAPSENETSESDFEAVDDSLHEINNVNLVLSSTSASNTPRVITLELDKIICEPPEEDIFADIFAKEDSDSKILSNDVASTGGDSYSTLEQMSEKYRSDKRETNPTNSQTSEKSKCRSQDENSITIDKSLLPSPKQSDREDILSGAAFLNKFNTPVAKISVTLPPNLLESNNQNINRTLGKLPASHSMNATSGAVKVITAEYMQAQAKLNSEQDKLQSERGFQERVATSISDQMNVETQELLSLFGIPYIISPMEAESQCAFLDTACLTEGTITDDSDVWLFGGQRVYKNFYGSGDRQLELYQLADIVKILNLDREKLCLIAMLVGGDYSEGIEGVGPVTALELLSEFSTNSIRGLATLEKFREWWDEAQLKQSALFETKIKDKLRKLKLKPSFPSPAVYEAYLNPTIDSSTEQFRWGNPDLDAIREYTSKKFGWDQSKCDASLLPLIRNLSCQADKSKQLTLDTFLTSQTRFELESGGKKRLGSKRLHTAVKKLGRGVPVAAELNLSSDSSSEEDVSTKSKPRQVKKARQDTMKARASSSNSVTLTPCIPPKLAAIAIPQKVQEETLQIRRKQRAIEVLKGKQGVKK